MAFRRKGVLHVACIRIICVRCFFCCFQETGISLRILSLWASTITGVCCLATTTARHFLIMTTQHRLYQLCTVKHSHKQIFLLLPNSTACLLCYSCPTSPDMLCPQKLRSS